MKNRVLSTLFITVLLFGMFLFILLNSNISAFGYQSEWDPTVTPGEELTPTPAPTECAANSRRMRPYDAFIPLVYGR